tara:strand:- start:2880 stop:3092 length:213 start_codon:yes stop_codon:yes gene_type:complete
MSKVHEGLSPALYRSDVARPNQLPLFTAVTAEPTAEFADEPIYRPDLAHTPAPRDWSDDNHGCGEWGDYA